ncbi:Nramp family divalent metal transporter [Flagellimonas flava]|uniref:NRAMP (Natural resistance-associated macrophage protein) metal ion transporters n=1 Tax=Flagellimonas flava TaxID=570519 RepID=A0A1M5IGP6_9FLAO|nr:Nramp family divalent metal transporter [Allomuricauda flava]SHG27120.1 NRAMP (natural resistance-associated macrophage protein) metal ion transporters [Allomuricauda flava]
MLKRIGPGILVAAAFVGPGTITVCTLAGVNFGYALLWAVLLSVGATIVLQEMSGRIGVVTQSGLMDVVRKELRTKWIRTSVIVIVLFAILIGNAAYEAGNIGGATLGLEGLFGKRAISSFYPLIIGIFAFILLWFSGYKALEKIFAALVGVMGICFLLAAILTKPPILEVLEGLLVPGLPNGSVLTVVALVGTTVVPYNLFLHASLAQEKWKSTRELKSVRWDTIISIGLGGIVSMAILIAAAAAPMGKVGNAMDLAKGLEPLFGKSAILFMAVGLIAAGITSAITAPLAAAFVASNCLGWKGGMQDKRFRFIWTMVLALGVFFLSFNIKPIQIIQFAQIANGVLLPVMAILLLWIVNRKSVMGKHRNSGIQNVFGLIIVLFSVFLGVKSILKVIGLF